MGLKMFEIFISAFVALTISILASRRIKLSKRYEIRELNDWKKLDKGIDPSKEPE